LVQRYDAVRVDNVEKNDSGFLTYDLLAAQTGVFPYRDIKTGEIIYELKRPDDLLTDEVLAQLNNLPITNEHPLEFVNVENSNDLVKGLTGEKAGIKNNKLANKATVFDGHLIAAITTGEKRECSLGYTCEIVEESGEFQGQRYDRRQTNFDLNHVAMVPEGRCGPDCSAKLDSKSGQVRLDGAYQVIREDSNNNKRSDKMAIVRLDGKDYEVPEPVKSRVDKLESDNEDLTKEVGQLEGKNDALEDTIENSKEDKKELEDNQLDEEEIDKRVDEKLALLEDANLFLADDYELEGKSNRNIKVDCIKEINDEFDAEGKADEYIDARFDMMVEVAREDQGQPTGENMLKTKQDGGNNKVEKKRNKRLNMRGDK
jgi:hypothetical protein